MALKNVFSIMMILIMICAMVAVIGYAWTTVFKNDDIITKIIGVVGMSIITVAYLFIVFLIWLGYKSFSK